MTPANPFLDPAALLRIRSLELRARMVMEGFNKGLHRSPHHGFSSEFSEYRAYARGDDPRHIDWKVAARTDRWYVKKFEDETNLRCHLLMDASASMNYTSGEHRKINYAATLGATLGLFLMQQGDAAGLTVFDQTVHDHVPAKRRPGQMHHLLTQLEKASSGSGRRPVSEEKNGGLVAALVTVPALIRRRALVVILSDFLTPLEGLETQLAFFAAMGHEVLAVQILDPAEMDFPFEKSGSFRDVETGRELVLDPGRVREQYLMKLARHHEALRAACARTNTTYKQLRTDAPLDSFLFEFLSTQQRFMRQLRQRR